MGAITSVLTAAGGVSAGLGAMFITEGVVINVGNQVVSTKFGRFCVSMCAAALGGAAFDKVNDMFLDQALQTVDAFDKLKKAFRHEDGEAVATNEPASDEEKKVLDDLKTED